MQNATEQDRQHRRLAIEREVSRILSQSRDLREAAPRILAAIGEGLSWEYAGLWTVDRRENVLRCSQAWHAPSAECPEFEAASRRVTFSTSVGLPGRVWASGEPAWITDIVRDANFAWMIVASSEGLRTAAAFPILLGGRVLGVFEFLGREVPDQYPETLEMMMSLGGKVGQFLERERSREAVEESEARKAAILEAAAIDAIISMDHEGRIVEWNPAAERTFGYTCKVAVGREMAELESRGVPDTASASPAHSLRGSQVHCSSLVPCLGNPSGRKGDETGRPHEHAEYGPKVDTGVGRVVGDEAELALRIGSWSVTVGQAEAEDGQAADDGARPAEPQGRSARLGLLFFLVHRGVLRRERSLADLHPDKE